MNNKAEKEALALVFGVVKRDSIVSAVPGFVPGLLKAVMCKQCTIELNEGLPVAFEKYMSNAQKAQYRAAIGYTAPEKKAKKGKK